MAVRGNPTWRGRSGNPSGRPPKSRALTEILERAGREKMPTRGGDIHERRKVLATMLWDAATTGEAKLPDGEEVLRFSPKDWLEVVKFLYQHIDGPAKPVQPDGGNDVPVKAKQLTHDDLADKPADELTAMYRDSLGETR